MLESLRASKGWMFLWVVGSVGGWISGILIAAFINWLFVYDVSHYPYLPFLPFLTTGLCLGLFQWRVALKGIVSGLAWIIATTLAGLLVAFAIMFVQDEQIVERLLPWCLSMSCNTFTLYTSYFLIVVIWSVAYGLAMALPTGLVLARYSTRIYYWVFACVLGTLLSVLTYFFVFKFPDLCPTLFSYAVVEPVVFAGVSAPFLHLALETPPNLSVSIDER